MTRPISKKAACPNCGAEDDFTIYTSINATRNPKLVEEMASGELFIWECPKCGKKYICKYPFMYYDMEKGIMQCLTFNIPEDKWEELGLSGIIELEW